MKILWLSKFTKLLRPNKFLFHLILYVGFCATACSEKVEERELESFIGESLMKKVNIDRLKTIMVIPNAGCNGCISEAEYFVSENALILQDRLFTVFTDVMSEKNLRLRIGKEVVESPHAFVDSYRQIQHEELISIYPSILYIKKGLVERVIHVSPDNPNALSELRDYYNIVP
jgi:hypothetical protein